VSPPGALAWRAHAAVDHSSCAGIASAGRILSVGVRQTRYEQMVASSAAPASSATIGIILIGNGTAMSAITSNPAIRNSHAASRCVLSQAVFLESVHGVESR
jgi:hypothetical protein